MKHKQRTKLTLKNKKKQISQCQSGSTSNPHSLNAGWNYYNMQKKSWQLSKKLSFLMQICMRISKLYWTLPKAKEDGCYCTFLPPYCCWWLIMKNVAESFTIAQTLTLGGYKNAIAPEDVGQILGIKCSEEIYVFKHLKWRTFWN